ncbi:hypothetical protein PQZ64_gp71 [Klebsiella phage vB_KpnM_IME346]|uniref:Uncharacterized protein n=1 Tax=Klebsiella phage vB_KpnM_IME346 TaxID=2562174 RepID=A0A4D6DRM9_9CAUD|nr:hypothetical protein PQZ64_gp71 [Klebsiella phage vB_KpnM_IME346]QBZ68970.1 hypothetical protein [Klebsiella phage vB_KpnM_IME346]
MTNLITLTIPNDDHIALRAFGKALIEIASAKEGHPVDVTVTPLVISTNVEERLRAATETLQQAAPRMMDELRFEGEELHGKRKEPEVDTTAQQVESLAANVVDREVHFDNPEPTTDSTGTPWDERIHSTSKALNADDTWRLRRKPKDMDEAQWAAFVEKVKLELTHGEEIREAMDKVDTGEAVYYTSEEAEQKMDELIEASNKMLEPPVTPPGDDFHTDEQTVAGIPPLPVPPPVVVAPPVPEVTEWDFPRLMTFLTERHGKIDVATVNMLLAQDGMSSVQELNAHPDKIGPFVARVKAHLGE